MPRSIACTLAAFATFGVGFVARPVGGIVFGHFGDRIGRKAMLVITLLLLTFMGDALRDALDPRKAEK